MVPFAHRIRACRIAVEGFDPALAAAISAASRTRAWLGSVILTVTRLVMGTLLFFFLFMATKRSTTGDRGQAWGRPLAKRRPL